jgi:hypothetical protein
MDPSWVIIECSKGRQQKSTGWLNGDLAMQAAVPLPTQKNPLAMSDSNGNNPFIDHLFMMYLLKNGDFPYQNR